MTFSGHTHEIDAAGLRWSRWPARWRSTTSRGSVSTARVPCGPPPCTTATRSDSAERRDRSVPTRGQRPRTSTTTPMRERRRAAAARGRPAGALGGQRAARTATGRRARSRPGTPPTSAGARRRRGRRPAAAPTPGRWPGWRAARRRTGTTNRSASASVCAAGRPITRHDAGGRDQRGQRVEAGEQRRGDQVAGRAEEPHDSHAREQPAGGEQPPARRTLAAGRRLRRATSRTARCRRTPAARSPTAAATAQRAGRHPWRGPLTVTAAAGRRADAWRGQATRWWSDRPAGRGGRRCAAAWTRRVAGEQRGRVRRRLLDDPQRVGLHDLDLGHQVHEAAVGGGQAPPRRRRRAGRCRGTPCRGWCGARRRPTLPSWPGIAVPGQCPGPRSRVFSVMPSNSGLRDAELRDLDRAELDVGLVGPRVGRRPPAAAASRRRWARRWPARWSVAAAVVVGATVRGRRRGGDGDGVVPSVAVSSASSTDSARQDRASARRRRRRRSPRQVLPSD